MRKIRLYLDTSVISHLHAADAPQNMAATQKLWREIMQGKYAIYISELVLKEIMNCEEQKQRIMLSYLSDITLYEIELTEEIINLAKKYVDAGIIPAKYTDDALHIAAATVHDCNVVVSWNFKHMVKLKTIIGVNGINKGGGYTEIEILPPNSITEEVE